MQKIFFLLLSSIVGAGAFCLTHSTSLQSKHTQFGIGCSPRYDGAIFSSNNRGKTILPQAHKTPVAMVSGNGFGSKGKFKLEYGGSQDEPATQIQKWELAYKAYIKTMGKYMTAASWEGFSGLGRGAVYVNTAVKGEGRSGKKTLYIPLSQYGKRSPRSEQETKDLQQILSRIETYDPEREFVVIFEAAGLMGTDVVRPSISPPEIHRILGTGKNAAEKLEELGDLQKYWFNPAPTDTKDTVDISSLIMDASEAEGSVLDITDRVEEIFGNDDQNQKGASKDVGESLP